MDRHHKKRITDKRDDKKLRLKITTDKGKDPANKSDWTYDELEKVIKLHAVEPVDPAILTKDMQELTRGENIDETNRKIEDWIESLGHATKARGNKSNTLSEEDRDIEIKRFEGDEIKDSIKWMLLRAHLPNDIAQAVRTYAITANEGLGLNNSKLITFVRQLEKNKETKTGQNSPETITDGEIRKIPKTTKLQMQ